MAILKCFVNDKQVVNCMVCEAFAECMEVDLILEEIYNKKKEELGEGHLKLVFD